MKKLFIFFILLGILFSHTFQWNYPSADSWITTDLSFSNEIKVSASNPSKVLFVEIDPLDLQNGDIICPMKVKIYPTISGKWGKNFVAQSPYPVNSEDTLVDYTQTKEYSIGWLDFDTIEDIIDTTGGVFADEQVSATSNANEMYWFNLLAPEVTHAQSMDFDDILSDNDEFPYKDKKGLANVVCNGQYTVTVDGSQEDSDYIGSINYLEADLLTPGTHELSAYFESGRCIALVKAPLTNSEYIFLFRKKPYYLTSHEQSITITVQAEAVVSLKLVSGSIKNADNDPPPFEFPGIVQVTVSVKNEGDVAVKFNGDNSITPNSFTVVDILPPPTGDGKWDLYTGNGGTVINYNTFTIDPGQTKKITFIISYPGESLPEGLNSIHIELGYESEEEDPCTDDELPPKELPFDIPIKEKEEPPPNPDDYSCSITPPSKLDMVLNDDSDFNLKCYYKNQITTCDGIEWSLTPLAWDLTTTAANPTKATVTPTTLTSGKLTAEVVIDEVDANCSANLKAGPSVNPDDYSCSITPPSKLDITLNTGSNFTLKCYYKNQITTCDGVEWSLTPLAWDLTTTAANPTKATVTPTTLTTGILTADVVIDEIDANCFANLASIPAQIKEDYSCSITPPSKLDMVLNDDSDFTLKCYYKNQITTCDGIEWSLTPLAWDLTTTAANPTKATVTPTTLTSGTLTADVVIDEVDADCSANLLSINNYTIEIIPEEDLDMTINVSEPFMLKCYNWGTQIQCGKIAWNLDPLAWKLEKNPVIPTLVFVTPSAKGPGDLSAIVTYPDGTASDSSILYANVKDQCLLGVKKIGLGGAESDLDLTEGIPENTQFKTYITCIEDGEETPCLDVKWVEQEGFSKTESNNEYISGTTGTEDSFSIVANAQVESGTLICSASGEMIHPQSCEISEEFFTDGFDDFKFRVQCYQGTDEIDCSKVGTGELTYDLLLSSGEENLIQDTDYTQKDETILGTGTEPDEHWLVVEIMNYLLNYPDGAEYDLTVTIPSVSGTERPTECEAKGDIGNIFCEFFL